jgi:hypothetical protein
VEQLTFGMIEPAVKAKPHKETPKVRKSRGVRKQKSRSTPRKAKTNKAEQAMLISKPVQTNDTPLAGSVSRQKQGRGSRVRKGKTVAKTTRSKLKTGLKTIVGKETTSKADKGKIPATKTVKQKPSIDVKGSKLKEPKRKAGRPKLISKTIKGKEKKTTPKAGHASLVVIPDKKPEHVAKRTTGKVNKSSSAKSTVRSSRKKRVTTKSAVAKTPIILPPSWKPKRGKSSPIRRIGKSTRPKN